MEQKRSLSPLEKKALHSHHPQLDLFEGITNPLIEKIKQSAQYPKDYQTNCTLLKVAIDTEDIDLLEKLILDYPLPLLIYGNLPPLYYACLEKKPKSIQYLLQNDSKSQTLTLQLKCLRHACREGHLLSVELLMNHQSDVESEIEESHSSLYHTQCSEFLGAGLKKMPSLIKHT